MALGFLRRKLPETTALVKYPPSLTAERKAKTTPAMASGLTDRVWTVDDLLTLMDPQSVTIK